SLKSSAMGAPSLAEEAGPASPRTDAVALCLVSLQHADGSWKVRDPRPPLGDPSPISYAALAIRGLSTDAPPGRRDQARATIERARDFVRKAVPGDTQDQVFKLLALVWSE